jgi:hypothetical protein
MTKAVIPPMISTPPAASNVTNWAVLSSPNGGCPANASARFPDTINVLMTTKQPRAEDTIGQTSPTTSLRFMRPS